jgi:hypothetical protein
MGSVSGTAAAYWRGHVGAWRSGGRSRREYCAAHGLSRKTFDWWAWRLDRADREAGGHADRAIVIEAALHRVLAVLGR